MKLTLLPTHSMYYRKRLKRVQVHKSIDEVCEIRKIPMCFDNKLPIEVVIELHLSVRQMTDIFEQIAFFSY